ncbi:MAG: hypothetical protein IJT13_01830 [Bacteroidaceae bacterium]|nr:hypothetical protein [Bacteroidaceae bacterium]
MRKLKERLYAEYKAAYTKWYALDQEERSNPGFGRAVAIAHEKKEAGAVMEVIERCLGEIGSKALREIRDLVFDEYWMAVEEKTMEEEK